MRAAEQPRLDARSQAPLALVRHLLAGQEPQEVRLAGPVRPDDPDPLAEPDPGVERVEQAGIETR